MYMVLGIFQSYCQYHWFEPHDICIQFLFGIFNSSLLIIEHPQYNITKISNAHTDVFIWSIYILILMFWAKNFWNKEYLEFVKRCSLCWPFCVASRKKSEDHGSFLICIFIMVSIDQVWYYTWVDKKPWTVMFW